MVTVEVYEGVAHEKLIGAVYLDEKRLLENVELVGRAVCVARKMNAVDCVILDQDGNLTDSIVVFRKR